tara:strand:+ start:111 stop:2459 length:2349 start_codon:yes stop_codon:yes gene_type:complete
MINESLKTQKDNLAKLMAAEDITVVHKKISTAYFDVKNRILACPIFKDDMSSELYDLFMGHEVGHALNTPLEGLHSTLKENRTLKGYLNVIEDVRIETAIKNKFPGLRKSFFSAYNELMEMDFFGLKKRGLQELSLIDKINLITKVGARVQINLNDEEQGFLDMAYACKTWEDVVECANAIYEWSKENEQRDENDESIVPQMFQLDDEDEVEDDEDSEDSEDSYNDSFTDSDEDDDDDEDNLPEISDSSQEEGNIEKESEEEESEGEGEETEPKEERKDTGGKEGSEFGVHDNEDGARESITEHSAHNNEEMFLSEANVVTQTTDLKPKFKDIEKNVITYKNVIQDFEKTEQDETTIKKALKTKQNLQNKNKKIVNHMAKQFDMKQSAKRAVHAFNGKTGKLDMNKLAKYQIVDDIFKRVTYLPEGKNHGINVLLDWSGSIVGEVRDLLEQSIILAEFCRKTEIPFRVYAFSDVYCRGNYDNSGNSVLIELISSEMTSREFDKMYTNLAMIWDSHFASKLYYGSWKKRQKNLEEYNNWYGDAHYLEISDMWNIDRFTLPRGYSLGGTPLDECLVYMRKLIPLFNKKYGIEKSILTVITDGYSHSSSLLSPTKEERELDGEQMKDDSYYSEQKRVRQIIDPYSRKVYKISKVSSYYSSDSFYRTQCILDWIQKETGVIVNGYFVLPSKKDLWNLLSFLDKKVYDDDVKKLWTSIRKTGQVMDAFGYNKLFLTSSSALNTQGEDTLDDELIDAKKVRVLAAFKRNQNSKTTSRFLTNEFIKEIA